MANRVTRSRFPSVVRAPQRQTNWLASADITAPTNLAAGASILDQAFTQAQIQGIGPATIVRTRGLLLVGTDQEAATEFPFGGLGMMVVREQARAAGIASLPTPIAEEFDDGFFLHQFWGSPITLASAVGQLTWQRWDFDSKAQRKITPDDAIVVTLENASALAGVNYILKFRMLLKLH